MYNIISQHNSRFYIKLWYIVGFGLVEIAISTNPNPIRYIATWTIIWDKNKLVRRLVVTLVWGRARYLSIAETPHNIEFLQVSWEDTFAFWNLNARAGFEFYEWIGKKYFCFFQATETGNEPLTLAWKAAVLTTTLGPPPSPRSSELQLRPPGFELRIMCLNGSVISFFSPSSEDSPGPV